MLDVVIFDVDHTPAETERDRHRPVFDHAFQTQGSDVRWNSDECGELLENTGGQHRISYYLRARGMADSTGKLTAAINPTKAALLQHRRHFWLTRVGGYAAVDGSFNILGQSQSHTECRAISASLNRPHNPHRAGNMEMCTSCHCVKPSPEW